jgi:hypothetical protein
MTPTMPSRSNSQALGRALGTSTVPGTGEAVGLLPAELRKSARTAMPAAH